MESIAALFENTTITLIFEGQRQSSTCTLAVDHKLLKLLLNETEEPHSIDYIDMYAVAVTTDQEVIKQTKVKNCVFITFNPMKYKALIEIMGMDWKYTSEDEVTGTLLIANADVFKLISTNFNKAIDEVEAQMQSQFCCG